MLYEDITRKIIGCAMTVHSHVKSGYQEVVYQRALSLEMKKQGLSFTREYEMNIYYDNVSIGTRRVDFFVECKIMLEIKAVAKLEDVHLTQAINYLEMYQLPVGLLINFGSTSLEFKRVYNTKHPLNIDYKLNRESHLDPATFINPTNPTNPTNHES